MWRGGCFMSDETAGDEIDECNGRGECSPVLAEASSTSPSSPAPCEEDGASSGAMAHIWLNTSIWVTCTSRFLTGPPLGPTVAAAAYSMVLANPGTSCCRSPSSTARTVVANEANEGRVKAFAEKSGVTNRGKLK